MIFEYDSTKSTSNKVKHGIDFEEARLVWDDEHLTIIPANSGPEPRFAAIGRARGKLWTVIFTPRGDSIRLISARHSRPKETIHYEQGQKNQR
ncbi:MAG: BrnT family toxin [Desulfovibrio sp.]|jgi:uncharacterized DUF497 family protein|nr:BrnT family toxin [Desulfovibrio sp.]